MPNRSFSVVVQHLRANAGRDGGGRTDGELLTQFLSQRDEDALAALVERHAPMVWGVCRRVLRDPHDAEDAFQATFLVLVQKAATVVPREMLANWLYGVARQTAVRLRAMTAKRGWREMPMAELPEPAVAEARDEELLSLLDEELGRLPERFRALIVLCDLEGRTRKEAARQLGCPEGTVASGLARARELLAKRLTRRGLAVSGGALVADLSLSMASAPPALVANTIKAASVLAAGKVVAAGAIPVQVAALTDGVIKAMFMTKLTSVLGVALVVVVVSVGGTSLSYRTAAGKDGNSPMNGGPTSRTVAVRDDKKPGAEKPQQGNNPSPKDLSKIEPPGGVPLSLVKPGTNEIGVDQLNKVSDRLRAVPEKDLEKWVVELERIIDVKLKDGLPSPRQACRTDFVVRMSVAFDDLKWNATVADKLYDRACTMPKADAKGWKEAFEVLLKVKIGFEETEKDTFSNLPGGPPWAVPLVLIPITDLHEGQKYSAERGKRYLSRLKQLTKDDVSLWRDKVDRFQGTELDAAVNIILLDEFFDKENFQRDKFKATVERQAKKPDAGKKMDPEKDKEAFTAWGKEVDGLQAGLGFKPGEKRVYRTGETVKLVVRVRNVGKKEATFEYLRQFFIEIPPTVTDSKGTPILLPGVTALGRHTPIQVSAAPGKEIEVYTLELKLKPASENPGDRLTNFSNRLSTIYGTGTFQIQYERVLGNSSSGTVTLDAAFSKLATGTLELEVTDKPPEGEKKPGDVPAQPKPEAKKVYTPDELMREKYDSQATRTVEFKVAALAKPTEIKQSKAKDSPWVIGHGPDDLSLLPRPPKKFEEKQFSVILTSKVVGQLKRIGIKDVGKHFEGKTIRVSGRIRQHNYSGDDPPVEPHYDLIIEDVNQIEAVE